MAGIGITRKDFGILDELMLVSSTRGTDGAGIAAGRGFVDIGPRKSTIHKLVADPYYWKWTVGKKEDKIFDVGNTWFMGHTRSRSVGEINDASTQPYQYNDIVGTHNGTIQGIFAPFNTDSEKLLGRIAVSGIERVVNTLTEKDAYALVWYNFKEKELHFFRNKRRELWFAQSKDRSVMYWASEERFLDFALDGEEVKKFYFEEDTHYSIKVQEIRHTKVLLFKNELLRVPDPKEPDYVTLPTIPANDDGLPPSNTTMGETQNELDMIPWIRNTPNSPSNKKVH